MFKLLEKPPFVRWKFVQRVVHKHRMSKSTGTNRYKTFSGRVVPSEDTEEFIDTTESFNESASSTQDASSKSKSPFYTRRKLDKANAEMGLLTQMELDASPKPLRRTVERSGLLEVEEIDTTETTGAQGAESTEIALDNNPSNDCASTAINNGADKTEVNNDISTASKNEKNEIEVDNHLISKQNAQKPQYNPLSFQRSSKLRNSLKEFKRRSSNHFDSARQSLRRRTDARKYDNLEDETKANNNDEIVSYDHSPGAKRRQQITRSASFRKSMRSSGKYILAGMQQLPGSAIAQGLGALHPTS